LEGTAETGFRKTECAALDPRIVNFFSPELSISVNPIQQNVENGTKAPCDSLERPRAFPAQARGCPPVANLVSAAQDKVL